jgi:hypothetical protein
MFILPWMMLAKALLSPTAGGKATLLEAAGFGATITMPKNSPWCITGRSHSSLIQCGRAVRDGLLSPPSCGKVDWPRGAPRSRMMQDISPLALNGRPAESNSTV